MTVISLQYP